MSDDSDIDETWLPLEMRNLCISDEDESNGEEVGALSDGGGDMSDSELPDLDDSAAPRPSTSARQPAPKKSRKERKVWQWEKKDLPPQKMPSGSVTPKNTEHCYQGAQFFLEMFGHDNIELITIQTNIMRTKLEIERNRPMPPITEKEIRQWLGIHLYMSVVHLPSTQLHWNRKLRNEAVAGTMSRDRFTAINSVIHLSDNDLQVERDAPGYDRIFKVRQFLTNILAHFKDLAEIPKVCIAQYLYQVQYLYFCQP